MPEFFHLTPSLFVQAVVLITKQARSQTNAIGAIYNNKLFAVGLYECTINSQVFYAWIEQILLPELPPNSVLVMDNATFHKRQDTQDLITKQGHTILWLPPYSFDLNPIKQVWSWIKRLRQDWSVLIVCFFIYFMWICGGFWVWWV